MYRHILPKFLAAFSLFFVACEDTSMTGTSDQTKSQTTPAVSTGTPNGTTPNGTTPNGTTPNGTIPNSTDATAGPNSNTAGNPTTGTTSNTPIVPDEIKNGMEVINSCDRCFERAKQLSPQAGFQAAMDRTVNLGSYKMPKERGLCDIHFLASPQTPIADHSGQDSILTNQIALYCPCSCGWAKSDILSTLFP